MGFSYAGSLGGAGAPVVRRLMAGSDLYVGQFVMQDLAASGTGGHVKAAAVASETFEDDQILVGFVSGIADNSRSFVAPATGYKYGDKSTYTVSKAVVAANLRAGQSGAAEVDVTLALPQETLIRAPLYDTTYGTALAAITNQTEDTDGTEIVTGTQQVDIADDYGTIYCRSGANRGQYRTIASVVTTKYTVDVPFPYTIAVGDVFVAASCTLGFGGMDFTTGIDAIDGDNDLNAFYSVYYHEINLEEAGQEYAVFALWSQSAES